MKNLAEKTILWKAEIETPVRTSRPHSLEEEEKIKKMPKREQAESKVYRAKNGNLAIPNKMLFGALRYEYTKDLKYKKDILVMERNLGASLRIDPIYLDLGTDTFEIDEEMIIDPKGKIPPSVCYFPRVDEGTISGKFITTMDVDELKGRVEDALTHIGQGNKFGYGRFKLTSWEVK